MKRKIILFVLVAIRMFNFNIRLYFPVIAREILYCDPVNIVCFPNTRLVTTIRKLGKNKFTRL
jgi:hypothetical protein